MFSSLYTLDTDPIRCTVEGIFSHFLNCLFTQLTICYAVWKLLNFHVQVFVNCQPCFLCYQSPEPVSGWD